MLNTFENAGRNESRRSERNRQIRAMADAYETAGEAHEAHEADADAEDFADVEADVEAEADAQEVEMAPPSTTRGRKKKGRRPPPQAAPAFLDEDHVEEDLIALDEGPNAAFKHSLNRNAAVADVDGANAAAVDDNDYHHDNHHGNYNEEVRNGAAVEDDVRPLGQSASASTSAKRLLADGYRRRVWAEADAEAEADAPVRRSTSSLPRHDLDNDDLEYGDHDAFVGDDGEGEGDDGFDVERTGLTNGMYGHVSPPPGGGGRGRRRVPGGKLLKGIGATFGPKGGSKRGGGIGGVNRANGSDRSPRRGGRMQRGGRTERGGQMERGGRMQRSGGRGGRGGQQQQQRRVPRRLRGRQRRDGYERGDVNLALRRYSDDEYDDGDGGRRNGHSLSAADVPLEHTGRKGGGGTGGEGRRSGVAQCVDCVVSALEGASRAIMDALVYVLCDPRRLFVLAVVAAGITLGAIHIVRGRGSDGDGGGDGDGPLGSLVHPHHPYPNHNLARIESVAKRIINSGASTREELSVPSDPDRMPRTPQNRAMEWIALSDPRRLEAGDDLLLQRYGLAVLWFATHPDSLLPDAMRASHHAAPTTHDEKGGGAEAEAEAEAEGAEEGWTREDYWMTGKGICAWYGVRCKAVDRHQADPHEVGAGGGGGLEAGKDTNSNAMSTYDDDGEVTALLFDSNGMGGTMPDEIFTTLTELEVVDFNKNALEGILPESLGRLKRVHTLSLNGNSLRGTLPTSISNLVSMRDLDFGNNMFSGTIPGRALSYLDETLVELSLYGNDFTGTVPTELGKLTRVTSLYLDSNKLTGYVPKELEGCKELRDLRLRDNGLTGNLPDQYGELKNLRVLYLDTNDLTGWLPISFGMLSNLEEMNLYDNELSGPLPDEWSGLTSLKHMYLDGNGALSGTLPTSWLTSMTQLKHLYLSNNKIRGAVPQNIGTLSSTLEKLHLRNNNFGGAPPASIGLLRSLRELMLEQNLFEGTVPQEWGSLRNLTDMALQVNKFSGTVPAEVCALTNLQWGNLTKLTVRCQGMEAEGTLGCDCCTEC